MVVLRPLQGLLEGLGVRKRLLIARTHLCVIQAPAMAHRLVQLLQSRKQEFGAHIGPFGSLL